MNTASVRYGASLLLAGGVTFFVFWGMQQLITQSGSVGLPKQQERLANFLLPPPNEDVQVKRRQPKKPPAKPAEPPTPDLPAPNVSQNTVADFDLGQLDVSADLDIESGLADAVTGDGEAMPIVTVAPIHPRSAAKKGIGGYVTVEFNINEQGNVVQAVIIESAPPKIFDQASLDAIYKFKYRPKMKDGKAIVVKGVRKRFRFESANNNQRRR